MSDPAMERNRAAGRTTPPPNDFDVDTTVSGTVTWVDGGLGQHLSTVDVHIHASRTALISLCASIGLKGWKQRVSIYMIFSPEIIRNLVPGPAVGGTRTLEFFLTARPTVVTPDGETCPKNEASQKLWELWGSLARQRAFTVSIPARAVPSVSLRLLCGALSARQLSGPADSRHIDGLYTGFPVKIHGDVDSWASSECPPAYHQVAPFEAPKSQPAGLQTQSSESRPLKRPRSASLASVAGPEKRVFAAPRHEGGQVPSDSATEVAAQPTGTATSGEWVKDAAGRDLSGVLTLINTALSGMRTEMSDLRTEVSGLRTEVSDLRTGMTDLRTEVSDLRTGMTDLHTEVSDLRTGMMDLRTEVSDLRTQVRIVSHPDAELQEQIDELRGGQDGFSLDLVSLHEDVDACLAAQDDLEEHICGLIDDKVRDSVHEALDGAEVAAKCDDVTFRIVMGE